MFSYYGSKSKIIKLYPEPIYNTIIEPFAGSARYALKYWENEVQLYDTSKFVVEVWKYLISASEKDILTLPDVPSKVNLDNYTQLIEAERYLIGFSLCRGKSKPRKVGHGQNSWAKDKIRIAKDLYKIRHWTIEQKSFINIPNQKATWFIDPPYINTQERKGNTDKYPCESLDYELLAEWIKLLQGQVIACEGAGATYLPFKYLTEINANTNNKTVKKLQELIYTNEKLVKSCQSDIQKNLQQTFGSRN